MQRGIIGVIIVAAMLLILGQSPPLATVSASGTAVLDGMRDAAYGAPIGADPTGDLASSGPADFAGTTWSDQTNLYAINDGTHLYVYADLANYSQSVSTGSLGLIIDGNNSPAGGSADPWGNAITFAQTNLPDYVIRGNIVGSGASDDGWTELRIWAGGNWGGGGVNWGGLSGGQIGTHIAYADNNGVEFKIPLADIGASIGNVINLEFFGTQTGSSKGAYDTVPSDDQSTAWDDATTQTSYAAYALVPGTVTISDARAIWLEQGVLAWNGAAGASYKLLYDPDGQIDPSVAGANPYASPTSPGFLNLVPNGTINGVNYPKNPNTGSLQQLDLDGAVTAVTIKALLKGQIVVAVYDGSGALLDISGVQIQSVLDDLYAAGAQSETLGVSYSASAPTVQVWAPTAKSVTLRRYADSSTAVSTDALMNLDANSGVWSLSGDSSWDKQFYLFDVEVYVPETDAVENNLITDPYSVSLSTNSERSQFVDLSDTSDSAITPTGWTLFSKPPLAAPEDIAVYEAHVRDFSRDDLTVTAVNRGTFKAFTETGSDGMQHLLNLQAAGLTHVHLMPAFDIASVNETTPRSDPNPVGFARDSDEQQTAVAAARAADSFNWGYDPFHYGAPEGSYSTNPDGEMRIKEFREMVKTLNEQGLRVVMDVVYNHTAAVGQEDKSVLAKIVPGYYYRYTLDGTLETSSCCADTAAEYAMMEKLMLDTMIRWARDYKVDGFRFDLMNLHTVENALNAQTAVQAIDADIYVYGEGWDFGSAKAKGLDYAKQTSMNATGIGTFNDRIRDAAHGGYNSDPLQIRHQGFINGLSYDWNGYCYTNRDVGALNFEMSRLRTALAGSIADYTADPQETVNYVSKHDNETLFDQNVFKAPNGSVNTPDNGCDFNASAAAVSGDERVRMQNMGLSLVGLAQGVPFFHMGSDVLRSKSLDRNSYDSGDWFNRVDWTLNGNNFGKGLPPAWDNAGRWDIMRPLLVNTSLDPSMTQMQANAAHLREILRIRSSSKLFRLETAVDINARVAFYNTAPTVQPALLVMGLSDAVGADLDSSYEYILVFFNANKVSQNFTIDAAVGLPFVLHPLQADGVDADAVVQTAVFDDLSGAFTIPARTTAVFVSTIAPVTPPPESNINWVGNMDPAGGGSIELPAGAASSSLDVEVQVYQPDVTVGAGQGAGIDCYLHWGKYGQSWADLQMTYSGDRDGVSPGDLSNDAYQVTLPVVTLNGLDVGTYGFTAYCSDDSGLSKRWRANPGDGGDAILSVTPPPEPDQTAPSMPGGVFVHLFEWPWNDITLECPQLAAWGYTAVQISPPQEHITGAPWWTRYQPVSYDLTSRSGTLAEFQNMVSVCRAAGVDIYVDAVINHMTGPTSSTTTYTGSGGTLYRKYAYPYPAESLYGLSDFHAAAGVCPTASGQIENYADRAQVQNCELLGLADLNYGRAQTLAGIQAYLNGLIGMGVKGFRIDGAKHLFVYDIEQLLVGLDDLPGGGRPYLFQEVIEAPNEAVQGFEYVANGDVTEFDASNQLGAVFSANCSDTLSDLQNFAAGPAFLHSNFAVVFSDNHDNQRGHGSGSSCIVTYQDGVVYDLANIFMLAWPYGYPKVMSSFAFSDDDQGPPAAPIYSGGSPAGCNGSDWVCEHRRTAVANMVQFRKVTYGEAVTDWETITSDHIAFGRGAAGFVAINNSGAASTYTYQTGMTAGVYCDVTQGELAVDAQSCSGRSITVDGSGQILNHALGGQDAFAIHSAAQIGVCNATAPATGFEVAISLSGINDADVRLDWFGYGPRYDVRYSSDDPYFSPATVGMQLVPTPVVNTAVHNGVVFDPGKNYYYQVVVDNCAGSAESARVGKFSFDLAAGS